DVMTARLYVVGPRQTVQECLGIMTQGKLRHLPVVEGGQVVGLISIGDLVNAQLAQQRFLIEQMESYIRG
ncbi:MAG: CBS domain-containing protein, partial [Ottowia sp.]|nr:CBS domain-containing protein [Ottowia sp.]